MKYCFEKSTLLLFNVTLIMLGSQDVEGMQKEETFHTAACNGNVIRMKSLLDQNPQIIDSVGEFGHSALHWAAFNGKEEVVRALLFRGANVNSRNNDGEMPLHKACAQGDMQIVNLLINSGADINAATDDGSLPLHYAVEWGKVEVVQALLVLLERGDRLRAEKIRSSALRVAVEKNKLSIARLLVLSRAHERALDDKNTEPEALTQDDCKGCYEICGKEWPLHYAARYNSREAWFPLMKMGVLVNAQDNEGNTPLHYAARYDTPYLVKLLLDRGANHKLKNNKGETPLHYACLSDSVFNSKADKITMLLAAGANPREKNNEGKTCIDLVCPLEEQRDIDYLACLMSKLNRNQ